MSATITQVRAGLAAVLSTIDGLRVHETIPGGVNPPAAVIIPESGEIRTVSGGHDTQDYRIRLLVGSVSERTAQNLLDSYLASSGAASVRAAITANATLGGLAVKAFWTGWENYGGITWDEALYLGADALVTVET